MTARPLDSTIRRRLPLVALGLGLALAAGIALAWPRGGSLGAEPALSAEEIAATPDARLLHVAVSQVRWSMAGDAERQARWREFDEPVRALLALSWVENGDAGARFDGFGGFAALFSLAAPNRPTAEDLALAYEALGMPEMAVVAREAGAIAERSPADPRAYAEVDRAFRRTRDAVGTAARIQAYVRQHAAEIAAVRGR